MAEQRYKSPKSKSFDTFRDEEAKKSKNRKRNNTSRKTNTIEHTNVEPRTPPLPTGLSSIEELIKQRETLQDELNEITKKHASETITNLNIRKSNVTYTEYNKKRRRDTLDKSKLSNSKCKQQKVTHDSSPHYDENSEDEENIIEIRRKCRQQLIEKLKSTHKENHTENLDENTITSHKNANVGDVNSPIENTESKLILKDSTDMFAEIDDFTPTTVPDGVTKDNNNEDPQLSDNWDDPDGYYNIRIGDTLNNNRYTIKSILGKGVFANVVRAQDNSKPNTEVAIKITRNNELMHKTALKEIIYLKEVNNNPVEKHHCIVILGSFTHKNHLCLVLEPLYMDMRGIIKKYGRHGLNMKALMSYSRQLLLALRHLKKLGIIHADVKPDNILVNEKKNVLKLCDFGSAGRANENETTAYLVSRFYRAPEIILGMAYSHEVDLWSAACTIYEMAVGKIMFTGGSNNKMLKCFMDFKGKMSNKQIRKGKFKDQHFNYKNNFLLHRKDENSGREKIVEFANIKVTRDLVKELKRSITNERKLMQLKDLLEKMLMLDPGQRISVTESLKHVFIHEELIK